jgi:hypothetical protein
MKKTIAMFAAVWSVYCGVDMCEWWFNFVENNMLKETATRGAFCLQPLVEEPRSRAIRLAEFHHRGGGGGMMMEVAHQNISAQ